MAEIWQAVAGGRLGSLGLICRLASFMLYVGRYILLLLCGTVRIAHRMQDFQQKHIYFQRRSVLNRSRHDRKGRRADETSSALGKLLRLENTAFRTSTVLFFSGLFMCLNSM